MNISTNGKVVLTATRELSRKWEQTRQFWRDAKSDEFDRKFVAGLISDVERALPVMEELDSVITRMRRECE